MQTALARVTVPLAVSLVPAFAYSAEAPARPVDSGAIFTAVLENDIFADTDSNYTNGVRFAWMSAENEEPSWVDWLADRIPFYVPETRRISIAVGQSMFTPEDITLNPPLARDRPYGGWLYGSVGLITDTGRTLDNYMLTVGVVGPLSYARQTQTFVHEVIDSPRPRGWGYQLENEPGIMLTYEQKWRRLYEFSPGRWGADLSPHVGFNLGNVFTDLSTGFTLRFGYDLPADYGPPRIRPSLPGSDFFIPSSTLGWYMFAGAEGRGVARNIFLDGNTFQDSPSVDKKWLVGNIQAGIAFTYGSTRLSYTHVFNTKEFNGQKEAPQFGAVSLSYRF